MQVVVIYFSQTGNTEKIAYAIQTGVKQITGHCDILPIKQANPRRLYEYDLIGIGAPNHRGRETANVTAFIKDMRFVGGKHSFAFSTHGTSYANFFPSMVPKLKEKGLIVVGWRDWYGAGHGSGLPYPYLTDGHPDEIDLEEAEGFGREMVELSVRISYGEINLIPEVPAVDTGFMPPPEPMKSPPPLRESARYEKEKCLYPACRLCMDNCPVDGIDLTVDPPIFMQPCMGCGAFCEAICPTGAIVVDPSGLDRGRVRMGERGYDEGAVAALREAEAAGRFRRLVPEEEVGWDNPRWKVFDKHPRWVIGKGRI